MDKNIFEMNNGAFRTEGYEEAAQPADIQQLTDLQLAYVGGGIGNTVL